MLDTTIIPPPTLEIVSCKVFDPPTDTFPNAKLRELILKTGVVVFSVAKLKGDE
jgi:hypothetical protein